MIASFYARRSKFPKDEHQFENCIIDYPFRSPVMKVITHSETLINTRLHGVTSERTIIVFVS